eukprot:3309542-Rhodomonas_salina.1
MPTTRSRRREGRPTAVMAPTETWLRWTPATDATTALYYDVSCWAAPNSASRILRTAWKEAGPVPWLR